MEVKHRQGTCPDCGARATFYDDPPGWYWCPSCHRARAKRERTFRAELAERFPGLSSRLLHALQRGFIGKGGIPAVMAATDDELLTLRHFGSKMLSELRAVWPIPMRVVAKRDPWREHAEMVAGVR